MEKNQFNTPNEIHPQAISGSESVDWLGRNGSSNRRAVDRTEHRLLVKII